MSDTIITRGRGGKGQRQVRLSDVEIPDLWHVAQYLTGLEEPKARIAAEKVLECWHLCSDLKRELQARANGEGR